MIDKQIIIDDQKKTIHRLQDECTEKTNTIIALGEQLDQLKAENENWQKEYWKLEQGNDFLAENNSRLKQNLTDIKELVGNDWCLHHESCKLCTDTGSCINKQVLLKISEVDNEHITKN